MGFLDFFKKQKKRTEKRKKQVIKEIKDKALKKPEVKVEKKKRRGGVSRPEAPKPKTAAMRLGRPKARSKISVIAPLVLKEPHVTEKATELTKNNQYIFKVWPRSNKSEIKKAVEQLYNVNVEEVRIVNVPGRKRRLGRIQGWRKGYKKAIVKIAKDQKIEVLPR